MHSVSPREKIRQKRNNAKPRTTLLETEEKTLGNSEEAKEMPAKKTKIPAQGQSRTPTPEQETEAIMADRRRNHHARPKTTP